MSLMSDIADKIKAVTWKYDGQLRQPEVQGYPDDWETEGLPNWPMSKELRTLLEPTRNKPEDPRILKNVGKHIWGVVA